MRLALAAASLLVLAACQGEAKMDASSEETFAASIALPAEKLQKFQDAIMG
jgi:hypothetical protein